MFEQSKPFYMTKAISEELPVEHQQFLLQYFKHYHQLTDYLQIFEFYIENDQQWLKQWQEEPERETILAIHFTETDPIHRKVWVMDQVDYVMILFPEDY